MKKLFEIKRFVFYLWVALAFMLLWSWHDTKFKANFGQVFLNNLWRTALLIVVNYLFFEHALSFVLRKRRYIIYNVLLAIPTLWVFMMIWSFGLYAWRGLGVALSIYTPLGPPVTQTEYIETQMGYSVSSVF